MGLKMNMGTRILEIKFWWQHQVRTHACTHSLRMHMAAIIYSKSM